MEKTTKQKMLDLLEDFGKLYQLPPVSKDYFEALRSTLHDRRWTVTKLAKVLEVLKTDKEYAENAKYGKYPTIYDILHTEQKIQKIPFRELLAVYLDGCYWEKENILAMATPQQRNALTMAGGLERLFQRANDKDMPTQISKLVDLVSSYEAEAPAEIIDTQHRLEAPATIKTFLTDLTKNKGVKNDEEEKNN